MAEQPAVYDERERSGRPVWPAPGELAAIRRRLGAATQLFEQGRHAPGVRQLRQATAALARRDDWVHANDGAIALASQLLRRGQPRLAQAALNDAREYSNRSGNELALVDVAILSGHAAIDLGKLDEAERLIGGALAAGRGADDHRRVAHASLALARCLFWRGRYAEAGAILEPLPTEWLPPPAQLHVAAIGARVAVGLRDHARALSYAREGFEHSATRGDPADACTAARTSAFVRLAVGDLDGVEGDVRACVAEARRAHDPLSAWRARLLLAEAERRRGRTRTAEALVGRLWRVEASRLPPIVQARCRLLRDLLTSGASPAEMVTRHAERTGLQALALYVPAAHPPERSPALLESLMDDVVGIVDLCQTAEEETGLLVEICVRLRRQLRAAAVSFAALENGTFTVLAGDGARVDASIAERIAAANMPIAPHRSHDRVEAGAPVRYAGATIGALIARWTLGSSLDASRASTMLTMAATAAAPAVSAAVADIARRTCGTVPAVGALLGVSAAMADLRRLVERAAAAPFSVLVEGESGSGKELVARAIHKSGARRDRPFSTLNCAALPDELVETELFGHARGAFTGAIGERVGVFEEAHGGTLFLDEIGELSPRAQAKVLRVIQEGELRRVGENVSRHVDVRIVAATNRDLRQEVGAGRFRLDLLYRLDVIRIPVPPLRERRDDIAVLVDRFWADAARRTGSRATLAAATIAALARYDWPGNVRELQNVLAALIVRCPPRGVVPPTALAPPFAGKMAEAAHRLDRARRTFEERFVRAALVRSGGHRARAAAELGITRQGLTKLMTRLGINA